jgi:hypothetical protein
MKPESRASEQGLASAVNLAEFSEPRHSFSTRIYDLLMAWRSSFVHDVVPYHFADSLFMDLLDKFIDFVVIQLRCSFKAAIDCSGWSSEMVSLPVPGLCYRCRNGSSKYRPREHKYLTNSL